jgi:CotH kinase protein
MSALLLCLPGILLCLWYSWEAYASFDRYRRMVDNEVEFSFEEFQLQLFDVLSRDLRRIQMSSPPDPSKLNRFDLHISKQNLAKLYEGSSIDSGRPYIMGKIERKGKLIDMEVRLRGQRHWHNLGRQKSLKIRLPKGKLINGYRIFNLINDPMPMVVGEQLILDLARKHKVLTPESSFVRVTLNGADLGVMRFETQPDESLLRTNQMVPGSIYSGNLASSAKTEELWADAKLWRKSAWRLDAEEHEFPELEELLKKMRNMSVGEFTGFARSRMDLEAFATFDALDVAFGSDQHDFRENHKLHFDPYRGRWQPVAWNFRGFQHNPYFNLTENPFLLRFKMIPEYVSMRNRILYRMLVGNCSVSSLRSRGRKMLKKLAPELATDRYFDSYKLLTRIDRFHRQMLRPMSLERAALVFESELTTYRKRHSFLERELKRNPLWIHMGPSEEKPKIEAETETKPVEDTKTGLMPKFETVFDIVIDGRAGVALNGFDVKWPVECKGAKWQVWENGVALTHERNEPGALLSSPLKLYPSTQLVKRRKSNDKRGKVLVKMAPARYEFTLESTCKPAAISAQGTHLATDSRVRSRVASPGLLKRIPAKTLAVDDVPKFEAGEVAPAPAFLRLPASELVNLGPGVLEISETREFGAHQSVVVAPGTELRMAAGASLIFFGPVSFLGTASEPIVIHPSTDKAWGGIAIQGPATAGSSMAHVKIRGGSTPKSEGVIFPGMINVHDTKKIKIEHCDFGGNRSLGDVFHATYVKKLVIEYTSVVDAMDDAFDLEFVQADLRNIETRRVGDDALDLMGAEIRLADSVFLDAKGNGISAGEQSLVEVFDCLVAGAKVGVLAKNASIVSLDATLLWKNKIGVRVYSQKVRYSGESSLTSDVLYVVGSEQVIKRDKDSKNAIQLGRLQQRLPTDGTLDHLAENVLGISRWDELGQFVGVLNKGGAK